jgi:Tol biopolymer transport system component
MLSRITVVLASSLLCVLVLVAPAHGAFPGANGRLAYTSDDLYTINADGTGLQQLAVPDTGIDGPNWSADGSELVFRLRSDLAFINPDGSNFRTVETQLGNLNLGSWSPDSSKVVFEAGHDCNEFTGGCRFDIATINRDGTGNTRLTADGTSRFPEWSPSGDKIVFLQAGGPDPGLYIMGPNGEDPQKVPNTEHNDGSLDWSPDGQKIAFSRAEAVTTYRNIYSINIDGSGLTKLTDGAALSGAPVWSPDGTQIAFLSNREGTFRNIYTMRADGSSQVRVTSLTDQGVTGIDWQPIPGPRRTDYKTASQFCKAERAFLGEQQFRQKYGIGPKSGANAHGKCVRRSH